jgi:tetratricopeptide (TPR) repeat protein
MQTRQISLSSKFSQLAFGIGCLASICWYVQLCSTAYVASRLAEVPEPARLERAVRLESSNAEYRHLLGRTLWLSEANIHDAISNYQTAITLNPYVARYWLDLAAAYQVEGRGAAAEDIVESAVHVDPTTPNVAWEAANFLLSEGRTEKAFRYFRVVLDRDPSSVDRALMLCWRATTDPDRVLDDALPSRADLYLAFLQMLIKLKQTDSAEIVWNRLIGLKQPVPVPSTLPYFHFLIEQRQVAAAQLGWLQLAGVDPALAPYLSNPENLVVNGGFEEVLLNGGFDWKYEPIPHIALSVDTSEFHGGKRTLLLTFDGKSAPEEAGISEYIPVTPNTAYRFTCAYKTQDVETTSGPRVAIVDAYTSKVYFLGQSMIGKHDWDTQAGEFRTGPRTELVLLKIVRKPAAPLIRGKFWLDDLRLIKR